MRNRFCLGLLAALMTLSACGNGADVSKTATYRTLAPENDLCGGTFKAGAANTEPRRTRAAEASKYNCFVQQHKLPSSVDPETAQRHGTDVWASAPGLQQADDYTLAFVEMSEATGDLAVPGQIEAVLDQITSDQQTYVVTYVHGWRHNAAVGNTDVAKFRVLLAYARAALNTRCAANGDYCDAKLVGVYLSWRGASVDEPGPDKISLAAVPSILSYPTRKAESDQRAGLMIKTLTRIQRALSLRPGDPSADKMLVFGHSMGGNMLLTAASAGYADYLGTDHTPGDTMPSLLGDVTVLINPASEASKWTRLQRAERDLAGLAPDDVYLSQTIAGNPQGYAQYEALYPKDQRPVLVSLTSTGDWSALGPDDQKRFIRFDWATNILFPIGQTLLASKSRREDQIAVGHLQPDYLNKTESAKQPPIPEGKPARWRLQTKTEPLGASHEFALTEGAGVPTTYQNAANRSASWCQPVDGWLLAARETPNSGARGNFFDWGLGEDGKATGNIGGGPGEASAQWRNSHYMRNHRNRITVAPPRSPFWNARVLDNAIKEHKGFQNYVMWCAVNQLVLDDVTRPAAAPDIAPEAALTTLEALELEEQSQDDGAPAAPESTQAEDAVQTIDD